MPERNWAKRDKSIAADSTEWRMDGRIRPDGFMPIILMYKKRNSSETGRRTDLRIIQNEKNQVKFVIVCQRHDKKKCKTMKICSKIEKIMIKK